MRLIIDIREDCVYKYGTLVITNISPDPEQKLEVAVPGFKFTVKEEQPVFIVERSYGDERDVRTGATSEKSDWAEGKTSDTNDTETASGIDGGESIDRGDESISDSVK